MPLSHPLALAPSFIPFRWKRYEVTKTKRGWSPRRIACARNSVRRQKESIPLFPELATDQSVEQRMDRMDQREMRMIKHMRNLRARMWLQARCLRRLLSEKDRQYVMAKWQQAHSPADPVAFIAFVTLYARMGRVEKGPIERLNLLFPLETGHLTACS